MINAIVGLIAGAIFGFITGKYLSQFGFGCTLICNPKISTIYFAVIGLVLATN